MALEEERKKAEKTALLLMLWTIIVGAIFVGVIFTLKHYQSLQFRVDIKYVDFKLVDKTYYYGDGDSLDTYDIINGFEVKVSKYYDDDNLVKNFYLRTEFVTNKDSIPSVVKSMKKDILKSRKQDERISKEIEEIKYSLEE